MTLNENDANWVNDPSLKNIDAAKLQFLLSMANQGQGKSASELLPFLMSAAASSKKSGSSFSAEETDLILNVLRQGKSPQEIEKIERLIQLVRTMKRGMP